MPLAILLSRVLDRGVVLTGEVVIGVAGIDLLYLGLDVVLASVESLNRSGPRPETAQSLARVPGIDR